jgi:peroxin-3
VYLLTSSQLTILARLRYLSDVKAANARREQERQEGEPGIWAYISSANKLLPTSVTQWFFGADNTPTQQASEDADEEERLFLSYSWWLLHEGWRTIAARVEGAVDTVFGPLGLKRELTPESWAMLLGELRLNIEFQDDAPYDFAPLVLPPTPLPPLLPAGCPLPPSPAGRPHLARLLSETREHIVSPDARVLVDRGVDSMLAALESALDLHARHRRVADCLPVLNAWSKNVWEGIPDAGVEALLARPEFEAFAALVFGDWAPR